LIEINATAAGARDLGSEGLAVAGLCGSRWEEPGLETPVQIDFQGMDADEALRGAIAERLAVLEQRFGRITAGRVVVIAPTAHHQTGGVYEVHIHLSLPDGREVNVARTPQNDERHAKFEYAVNDAFKRARRRLQDHVRRLQGKVKVHEAGPSGVVARIDAEGGFGFIETSDGREVYFHRNSVLNDGFSRLDVGTRVTFAEEMGEKGPQATTVHISGKHGMR
jgi:cold shock CspA family protein